MIHSEWTIYRVKVWEYDNQTGGKIQPHIHAEQDGDERWLQKGSKWPHQYARGKWLVLRKHFLWPFVRGQSTWGQQVRHCDAVKPCFYHCGCSNSLFLLTISIWHSKPKSTSSLAILLPFETPLSLTKQDLAAARVYHKECLQSLGTLS